MKIVASDKVGQIVVDFTNKKERKSHSVLKHLKSLSILTSSDITYVSTEGIKTEDDWRILGFKLAKHLVTLDAKSVSIEVPPHCDAFLEGLFLGTYSFQIYKSKPKKTKLKKIYINSDSSIIITIERAKAKTDAQCLTRDMVNGTPEDIYSSKILDKVLDTFVGRDIKIDYYNEESLKSKGMNGHLAVNRASRHPAMTIKLTYEPKYFHKTIVMVGKGLTYDSGGLDIKTNGHMQTMKADKGGAMTVFGIMKGIADMGSPHKIVAYLAIAENMIDGSAYKADDVLTMKNGKTVHVKNTDAEGRIVLFDNLCLAEEENPELDEIYTFATLTGAAVFQFGNEACGMVGFNDKMKKKIKKVGDNEGEVFCNAEFHKYMMDSVDDNVADLSNTGTSNQGCQKAGLFLTNALTKKVKKKYLHLDIAGPAFVKEAFGSNDAGGTGFAVRTFLEHLT